MEERGSCKGRRLSRKAAVRSRWEVARESTAWKNRDTLSMGVRNRLGKSTSSRGVKDVRDRVGVHQRVVVHRFSLFHIS